MDRAQVPRIVAMPEWHPISGTSIASSSSGFAHSLKSRLSDGSIHIWRGNVKAMQTFMDVDILDDTEIQRLDRFRHAEARATYQAAHTMLRTVLSLYLKCCPRSLTFARTDAGKPFLENNSELHFNLSHSRGAFLIALGTGRQVGVDIEAYAPDVDYRELEFVALSSAERDLFKQTPTTFTFRRIWTAKEALAKACGIGLRAEPHSINVSAYIANSCVSLTTLPFFGKLWTLQEVDVGQEYAACVAAEGGPFSTECFCLGW